jgi:hypothetical protein
MKPYNNRCTPMTVPTGKPEIEIDATLPTEELTEIY